MSEKRFSVRLRSECDEVVYSFFDGDKLLDVDMIVDLLNEQQSTIEELRLQEKEKGVPVFVVRDGKNPIALFFNEQRASLYCQENMANLTYQQEKWCRVE